MYPIPNLFPSTNINLQSKQYLCVLCMANMVPKEGDKCTNCSKISIAPFLCLKCRMNFVQQANESCAECHKKSISNPFGQQNPCLQCATLPGRKCSHRPNS